MSCSSFLYRAAGYALDDVILNSGASLRALLAGGVQVGQLCHFGFPGLDGHQGLSLLLKSGASVRQVGIRMP